MFLRGRQFLSVSASSRLWFAFVSVTTLQACMLGCCPVLCSRADAVLFGTLHNSSLGEAVSAVAGGDRRFCGQVATVPSRSQCGCLTAHGLNWCKV